MILNVRSFLKKGKKKKETSENELKSVRVECLTLSNETKCTYDFSFSFSYEVVIVQIINYLFDIYALHYMHVMLNYTTVDA